MKTLAQGPIVWQLIIMPQGGMLLACLKDILHTLCDQLLPLTPGYVEVTNFKGS